MGFIEIAGRLFNPPIDDDFQVRERRKDIGWVEWSPSGGIYVDLAQMQKLKDMGKLGDYSVERQEDGRYLINVRE